MARELRLVDGKLIFVDGSAAQLPSQHQRARRTTRDPGPSTPSAGGQNDAGSSRAAMRQNRVVARSARADVKKGFLKRRSITAQTAASYHTCASKFRRFATRRALNLLTPSGRDEAMEEYFQKLFSDGGGACGLRHGRPRHRVHPSTRTLERPTVGRQA